MPVGNDTTSASSRRGLKHGGYGTRLYLRWAAMLSRCRNPNNPRFGNYGGRGITVCPEWLDFRAFRDWAHLSGYRDDLTIERKDVNGDYCPENCTWIPGRDQGRNTTTNRFLTAFGETKIFDDWMKDPRCTAGCRGTLYRRLKNLDPEKAITMPLIPPGVAGKAGCKKFLTAFGETKSLSEWCDDPRCKTTYDRLKSRVFNQGWDHEEAISTPTGRVGYNFHKTGSLKAKRAAVVATPEEK